jgi:hypothetical protein
VSIPAKIKLANVGEKKITPPIVPSQIRPVHLVRTGNDIEKGLRRSQSITDLPTSIRWKALHIAQGL